MLSPRGASDYMLPIPARRNWFAGSASGPPSASSSASPIGSGIFRTPAAIAARAPDPTLMMGVWVRGGFTTCGALSVAELAGALPQTGGLYVYLREG